MTTTTIKKNVVMLQPLGACPICKEDSLTIYRYQFEDRIELVIECSADDCMSHFWEQQYRKFERCQDDSIKIVIERSK